MPIGDGNLQMAARDTQAFCREAETYARDVVALMGDDEPSRHAGAARVIERLSVVLEGMIDGMPAADMAVALRGQ
jgi:hypothetical protein